MHFHVTYLVLCDLDRVSLTVGHCVRYYLIEIIKIFHYLQKMFPKFFLVFVPLILGCRVVTATAEILLVETVVALRLELTRGCNFQWFLKNFEIFLSKTHHVTSNFNR